ncbi:MAG: sulfatase-like hydrolase/transferase [Phycisphaera sp.]|nr:sulfatase-like hydrolase/transferase [Phycisphaera sp.]
MARSRVTQWPLALIMAALTLCAVATHVDARQPNVIIVLTDDQGSVDANCYGSTDLTTPGIDMLAARGVRFTQFYAAAPVCSPSRAGLLTGRYPVRAGMPGNAGAPPVESVNDLADSGGGGAEIAAQITIAEMLKKAGYATAHIGKWHLHCGPGAKPLDQGFDYSFGHMGGCIDNYTHFFYWSGPNRHDLWENNTRVRMPGRYFPDLMLEKASAFIDAHKDSPFFMYYAMNNPHYPYQGDPVWVKHYEDAHVPFPRSVYAAFVTTLDERIKALIGKIDAAGLKNDTIVIYQSDHGHSVEERAHGGGGSNGPYVGHKFTMFEGGLRVLAVISWPGHLPAGEVRDQLAHGCDWMPTIAELCGVPLLNEDIDGKSIVKMVKDADAPSPHDVVHWELGGGKGARWAVRQGPWKLQGNVMPAVDGPKLSDEDRRLFLSNLDQDVAESKNLAADHPDVVARLKKLHDAWEANR